MIHNNTLHSEKMFTVQFKSALINLSFTANFVIVAMEH